MLFEGLELKDATSRIQEFERIYYSKKTPRVSKTLSGMMLSREYYRAQDFPNLVKINEEILKNEKDVVLRNLSGLNIIHIKLNQPKLDTIYLDDLFKKLDNRKNPFLNVVREKKGIYYIKQNEKEKAKEVFDGLLSVENSDENLKNRINDYIKVMEL
jgi:predicted negative regulator of RcsB-dependent stress response